MLGEDARALFGGLQLLHHRAMQAAVEAPLEQGALLGVVGLVLEDLQRFEAELQALRSELAVTADTRVRLAPGSVWYVRAMSRFSAGDVIFIRGQGIAKVVSAGARVSALVLSSRNTIEASSGDVRPTIAKELANALMKTLEQRERLGLCEGPLPFDVRPA